MKMLGRKQFCAAYRLLAFALAAATVVAWISFGPRLIARAHAAAAERCLMTNEGRYLCAPAATAKKHARVTHHRTRHRHVAKHRRAMPSFDANGNGIISVPTAANITIRVAPSFAPKIVPFIRDVVASGYHPRQIHCYARGGHVRGSLHYRGEACDFDQRGWGLTARAMYHVRAIAARYGLRDGCSFRDCGHIDSGALLARHRHHRHRRLARRHREHRARL